MSISNVKCQLVIETHIKDYIYWVLGGFDFIVANVGHKEFPNVFKSLSDSRSNGPRLTTNEQNETH